jgi:hypothetical protein
LSRRSIATLVATALLGIGAGGVAQTATRAASTSNVQTVYVRNVSTFVSDAAVKNALPAFQDATSNDFAPIWKVDAKLGFIGSAPAPAGAESITLVDKGKVKGALAYHEMVNGVPDSIIYVGTAKYYSYSWTVGFTHELWEQLADVPAGAGAVDAVQNGTDGRIWAKEIADPVESDKDGYNRPGANGRPVRISDFVTEKWFGALIAGPYDFMNRIQTPLQIDKGGYAQYWTGIGWTVVDNFDGCGTCRTVHW